MTPAKLSAAVVCLLPLLLCAQTPTDPASGVVSSKDAIIRVQTNEVVVDVGVSGKGAVPGSLAAKDFSVFEDGKPQKINSVSSGTSDPETADRHFVLVFDFTTLSFSTQGLTERYAAEFIDAMASPDRYMAVIALDQRGSRLVQGFTSSTSLLRKAVALPFGTGAMQTLDNLIAALDSVATSLAPAPGRKALLLFTGGQTVDPASPRLDHLFDDLNRANIAVYVVASNRGVVDAAAAPAGRGGRGAIMPNAQSIDRGNAVDLSAMLAEKTNGALLPYSAKLTEELSAIARQQDEYYRVSYTPPPSREGSCHTLRVSLNVKGLTPKSRTEYCTGKQVDVVAGKIAGQALESRVAGKPAGTLNAFAQLPWFYTSANRASVRLALELVPAGMKFEKTKDGLHGEIDIVGTLLRPDGSTAARFADTVDIDPPDQTKADEFTRSPWLYQHAFNAAPGDYTFQLALGAGPGSAGKLEVPFKVNPRNPTLAMSALAFSTEVRPVDTEGETAVVETQAPLVAGGREFIPSAVDRVSKSGKAYIYTRFYDASLATATPSTLKVEMKITDAKTGEMKGDTGMVGISSYIHAGSPDVPFGTALPIPQLTPGHYRAEFTVSHSGGPETAARTLDFEVF